MIKEIRIKTILEFQSEANEYIKKYPKEKFESFIIKAKIKYGVCRKTLFSWRKISLN